MGVAGGGPGDVVGLPGGDVAVRIAAGRRACGRPGRRRLGQRSDSERPPTGWRSRTRPGERAGASFRRRSLRVGPAGAPAAAAGDAHVRRVQTPAARGLGGVLLMGREHLPSVGVGVEVHDRVRVQPLVLGVEVEDRRCWCPGTRPARSGTRSGCWAARRRGSARRRGA